MRCERIEVGTDPVAAASAVRALAAAPPPSVSGVVAEIVATVRDGGDRALRELVARFDTGGAPAPPSLRVAPADLDAGLLDAGVRAGLEVAIANVALVADAGVDADIEVALPQGQRVVLRDVPVARAAIYVPGGRAPSPSSLVTGVVTARAAGVEEVVVLTAPPIAPVILGACALCGVHEVYAMGGAHGIAALAFGTQTIQRADVIAGRGDHIVQEAKRQVSDSVGIDGCYGPGDLLVLADASADPHLVALDLHAQGERGAGALAVAVSDSPEWLDGLAGELASVGADEAASVSEHAIVLAHAMSLRDALAFAEAFAPAQLELAGPGAERLARRVRSAGCVFVGAAGAAAFGDVAGSNRSLPAGGSARFASGLSPRQFRRRFVELHVGGAAAALAAAGAPVARAEGLDASAESMRARIGDNHSL